MSNRPLKCDVCGVEWTHLYQRRDGKTEVLHSAPPWVEVLCLGCAWSNPDDVCDCTHELYPVPAGEGYLWAFASCGLSLRESKP